MQPNLSTQLSVSRIQAGLVNDALAFLPELILCGGVVGLLALRLFGLGRRIHGGGPALILTLAALAATVFQWLGAGGLPAPRDAGPTLFSGLIVYDPFTLFLRGYLLLATAVVVRLTLLTGIPDREDSADFYCLLLGSVVGMCLMASANHLLTVYLGVEMASLPSYALAGFLKGRRRSSEAALKYVVYGGGAAGVMLYGISLLAGTFGTGYLPDLSAGYAATLFPPGAGPSFDPVLLLGTLFLLIGVAFKLAAVPFHFWCPDVFEGASAEVAGFLSVASKGAALALLARLGFALSGLDPLTLTLTYDPWTGVTRYLIVAIGIFAGLTATFGNLAAFPQTNLKRLLAYSTIAHAGYLMMALTPLNRDGAEALLFYLVGYLFMNLGAFACVAFIRQLTGSEDLRDMRGLIRRAPCAVLILAICLLSLLGVPPLVGFIAKFQVFAVLYNAARAYGHAGDPTLSRFLLGLLFVGGLNTVISAVYYLRVLKVMILDERVEDVEGQTPTVLPERFSTVAFGGLLAAAVVVLGFVIDPVLRLCREGAVGLGERKNPTAIVAKEVAAAGAAP